MTKLGSTKHPADCPCPTCTAKREVETFVMLDEIYRQGAVPWEYFGRGDPPPPRPLPERSYSSPREINAYEVEKRAALLSLAAEGLPKKRGPKKKHTDPELLKIMLDVDALHAKMPGRSDREVVEAYLRECYKAQGKREARVLSKKVQSAIKTKFNLLAVARKRFGKPRID